MLCHFLFEDTLTCYNDRLRLPMGSDNNHTTISGMRHFSASPPASSAVCMARLMG